MDVFQKDEEIGICSSYRLNDKVVDCAGLDINDGNIFNGKSIIEYMLCGGKGLTGAIHNVIYKTSFLKQINENYNVFNEVNMHADNELAFALCDISKFGFVFQVLSYTRRHNETGTSMAKRFGTYFYGTEILYNNFSLNRPTIIEARKDFYDRYSYFLLMRYLNFDLDAIKWHRARMQKKIGFIQMGISFFKIPLKKIMKHIPKYKKKEFTQAGW